jgi:coenzyme Q-binding protein COQ10
MHEVRNSETVPYTDREMFDLVADVDRYKEFLPWCKDSRTVRRETLRRETVRRETLRRETLRRETVRRETDNVFVAEIQVGYGPIHTTFATRNTLRTNRAIEIVLVEGPFEFLEGSWHFEPVPGDGCRVDLDLRFEFAHHHLEAPFDHVFKMAMETLVKAFKDRAAELYGSRSLSYRLSP